MNSLLWLISEEFLAILFWYDPDWLTEANF